MDFWVLLFRFALTLFVLGIEIIAILRLIICIKTM